MRVVVRHQLSLYERLDAVAAADSRGGDTSGTVHSRRGGWAARQTAAAACFSVGTFSAEPLPAAPFSDCFATSAA